jgi:hypothetical protein
LLASRKHGEGRNTALVISDRNVEILLRASKTASAGLTPEERDSFLSDSRSQFFYPNHGMARTFKAPLGFRNWLQQSH